MKPHVMMLAALTLATTACEDISSSDLLTNGMSAVIEGEADGSGETRVRVWLRSGGTLSNTMVDLQGDDELVVTAGDETTTLSKQSLGNLHNYVADVPVDEPGTVFTVALQRSVDAGAPSSTFQLPADFTFENTGTDLGPNQDLTFSWTPSGETGQLEVEVKGNCIVPETFDIETDDGSFDIPGADIEELGEEVGQTCPITVEMRRETGGELDPAFGEGGQVTGIQSRSFEATWTGPQE